MREAAAAYRLAGLCADLEGAYGFTQTPESLAVGETLGDKIRATAKDIDSDTAKATMKNLIGLALGWIFGG